MNRYKLPPGPGRIRGSKNKFKTFTSGDLVERLRLLDFDPINELVSLYRDEHTKPAVKFKVAETLAKLIFPAIRSVEVSGEIQSTHLQVSWVGDAQRLEQELRAGSGDDDERELIVQLGSWKKNRSPPLAI